MAFLRRTFQVDGTVSAKPLRPVWLNGSEKGGKEEELG